MELLLGLVLIVSFVILAVLVLLRSKQRRRVAAPITRRDVLDPVPTGGQNERISIISKFFRLFRGRKRADQLTDLGLTLSPEELDALAASGTSLLPEDDADEFSEVGQPSDTDELTPAEADLFGVAADDPTLLGRRVAPQARPQELPVANDVGGDPGWAAGDGLVAKVAARPGELLAEAGDRRLAQSAQTHAEHREL